jgi:hypothetical protein
MRTDPRADDRQIAVLVDDVDGLAVILGLDGADDIGDAVVDGAALDAQGVLAFETAPGFLQRLFLGKALFQFIKIENGFFPSDAEPQGGALHVRGRIAHPGGPGQSSERRSTSMRDPWSGPAIGCRQSPSAG